MRNASTPRIAVIALGGTIAMTRSPDGDGAAPELDADDLLESVPGLAERGVELTTHTLRSVPSPSLGLADLAELTTLVDKLADSDTDGVVVTQGTDTLEESAFFLDLTVRADIPLVVTGAMRSPSLAGADGPANLLAAIAVAAEPAVRGLGCLVVMSDEIHSSRHVRKTHTTSTAAFASPDTGPIGHLVEGTPRLLVRPEARTVLPRPDAPDPRTVPVVPTALGDDLALLRPYRPGLDGLVVAGFGVGHVPEDTVDLLATYAARVPVVLATRTGAGAVHRASYGYPGSEQDLQRRGLINAGFLDPFKARILLVRLLERDAGHTEISDTFAALAG
ncbi:L-asparaginase [Haloechinothrix alba]|uniref:L-asparaginase n=1 Tax=Haloechinothrix alba TaxID=664784 RepID=A0A238WQE1_9PSEU|nr:asparaginase [Haloechinothrix alba]SNR48611.1 L-asparaginase [Haloechinothrix alba]